MRQQVQALIAEYSKNRRSKISWVTFVAFALAPLFGGVFMFLMQDKGYTGLSGAFRAKAMMLSFTADWGSYLSLLSQAVGVGGVLIFGFAASWIFGREYSEGTAKDLLALPVSRAKILNAKFICYFTWCGALIVSNLILGLIIGTALGLPGMNSMVLKENLGIYFFTSVLVILLNTPVAFFAIAGRGFMAPLGIVAVSLVLAQIIGAMGFGVYFPWSVPGIYSGSGGMDLKSQLNTLSYLVVVFTGIAGYILTLFWWKYSDQT